MRTIYLLFSFAVLTAFSCSKGSAADKDTVPPVVTISSPTSGQVFTAGQAINIAGTISDDKFIAEAHVHVTNTNNSALLMDIHIYPNASTASFNQTLTAVAGVNYKIQVIAKDRAVNETTGAVQVSCN